MSETTQAVAENGPADPMSTLSAMRLTELKQIAAQLGIRGVSAMRKGDLINAIDSRRGGSGAQPAQQQATRHEEGPAERRTRSVSRAPREATIEEGPARDVSTADAIAARLEAAEHSSGRSRRERNTDSESGTATERTTDNDRGGRSERNSTRTNNSRSDGARNEGSRTSNQGVDDEVGARLEQLSGRGNRSEKNERNRDERPERHHNQSNRNHSESTRNDSNRNDSNRNDSGRNDSGRRDDDEYSGGRRSRRRRQRDRQGRRSNRNSPMNEMETPTVQEDDVLVDVSGILDVLDNYAFVRTSGYLPGPNDAFVAMGMVRKNGLRKGDVITGAVRQPREGERHSKYNPLVRLDTVNGAGPEAMRERPDFGKLTPLYPQERLRMETVSTNMTGRIIDLVSPIGKGQRGLIVSPPKAGKTMVMQNIANAITVNNPEVHLMVVLVDERPEEVTDFKRTTTAEVIASTFDRPADDHTTIAELAIARAKRLVELGRDVVVLLDGITRLGRAYNLAAPTSGRILSGGVDSAALYPPKRFFGAARNIENGGSLTILATALVETGSKMDEVIFEEFKGTGNMELKLSRQLADKRIFPAVDVEASSTRREELLMSRQELDIIWKLRRALSGQKEQQALETLLSRMKKTRNNSEFLVLISSTTPGSD
ncbi:transcription termination factor Rho [Propionibacterium freudenreichii]|uniref:transcription termination factor Rho n=1 Tax=Propionibacterium freudenreichii TaxID=1744 RepID=UPI002A11B1CF|nr:transcription termination factor Rho [Propionibacterium freudenreichii]MDK9667278.1 transcription termination factor Rho [Propionibacterium freudenreichii]